ncbi:MAG: formate dehydrogenase accessory sulfurtransferase FdhD [Myxococcaceae bacterium]
MSQAKGSTVKGTTVREALRIREGAPASWVDPVAVEEPLEIRVSSETLATTMRTPGNDVELTLGFLFSEGILRQYEELASVVHCGRVGEEGFGNVIDATAAPGVRLPLERVTQARRGTLTTSACGVCGRKSVEDLLALCQPLEFDLKVPYALLHQATRMLTDVQENFAQTGGVHAAVAISHQGKRLAGFEDVGRHNAVDKVVGALVRDGVISSRVFPSQAVSKPPHEQRPAVLAVSGRASFEIVQKATVAGIPVVASVSAASSLAIDLASKAGLTLATFVRGDGLNVYTHRSRILGFPLGV